MVNAQHARRTTFFRVNLMPADSTATILLLHQSVILLRSNVVLPKIAPAILQSRPIRVSHPIPTMPVIRLQRGQRLTINTSRS